MKISHIIVPHKKISRHGTVMWSDNEVQGLLSAAGVSLGSTGVPQHPFEIWRVGCDEQGNCTYECRQGERT